MMEATDHIIDLTTRFKKLETAQRDGELREVKAKKETQEIKQRLREVKHEMGKLKGNKILIAQSREILALGLEAASIVLLLTLHSALSQNRHI